jgi:dTDP-4-amino-4,6-dideoxygalactose transaminase
MPKNQGAEDRFASGYDDDAICMTGKMGQYTNYQACLGLRQMDHMAGSMARRVSNATLLTKRLRDRVHCQQPADADAHANYLLATVLVGRMPRVTEHLLEMGVDTKHHYMRDCSAMFDAGQTCPNAARAEREVLHVPAYPELSERQIERIAGKVLRAIEAVEAE